MLIFLFGQDTFRSRRKLKKLKEKFLNEVDPSGASLTVLNDEVITMEKINESVAPGSLLAKKRMIIIEDLFTNKEQAIYTQVYEYLKNKKLDSQLANKADNIIIFWDSSIKIKKVRNQEKILKIDAAGREKALTKQQLQLFKFLAKQKYTQQFSQLSNTETVAWLKKEVEARGGKIAHQAAITLTSLLGSDLWQASNEINKLLSFKLARQPKLTKGGETIIIEIEEVEQLVRGSFDENIFALTDAISNRNSSLATKLFEEQVEAGLTDSYLINMIVRQFRILLQVKQAIDKGFTSRKIISLLKLHPFIVQKSINQVRRFNLVTLKNILSQLIKIDYKMKSGQGEAKVLLNLLIARMGL